MRSFFAAVGPSALPLASVCVSVWLSACLPVCLSVCLSVWLLLSMPACQSVTAYLCTLQAAPAVKQ